MWVLETKSSGTVSSPCHTAIDPQMQKFQMQALIYLFLLRNIELIGYTSWVIIMEFLEAD